MKHKTANRIIIHVGKNYMKKQSELPKKDFSELFETLQRLEVQSFISGPLPAKGKKMFSELLRLNTWLQRSCSIKGVNFIDNVNIFQGHRQLFKLDGLHLNRLVARVLKDNIYFSLRHPSMMFANPLCLNGTHTPGQSISDHRTSFQLQSHHVAQHPRTTFQKTAREARTTFHSHRKHQRQRHAHQTHYLSIQHLHF